MRHCQDIASCPTAWALVLSVIGLWLLLPQAIKRGRTIGGLLLVISLGLFAADLPWLANSAAQGVFWLMSGVALVAAIGCVTAQSPVYSALWFALSLLGTARCSFSIVRQFLAVATIVVYAACYRRDVFVRAHATRSLKVMRRTIGSVGAGSQVRCR